MKTQVRLFVAVMGTLALLVATVFSALANGRGLSHTAAAVASDSPAVVSPAASAPDLAGGYDYPRQADRCPDMAAMGVPEEALWFATDEEQVVYPDMVVDRYPPGTSIIAAGFEYQCIPRGADLVILWKYGGFDTEPWVTSSTRPSPTNRPYVFHWSVYTEDPSGLPDGTYQAEFYLNEELLTSGEIQMGDTIFEPTDEVTVQGTIIDGKSKKPIKGALFFILEEGVATGDWMAADYPKEQVYTSGKTDASGKFVCDRKVSRNVTYAVMVGAKGYKPVAVDDFMVDDEKEDPVDLTVKLYK